MRGCGDVGMWGGCGDAGLWRCADAGLRGCGVAGLWGFGEVKSLAKSASAFHPPQ
jgi:hypothetical protein